MSRVLQVEVLEFVMISKLVWQALRNCQICLGHVHAYTVQCIFSTVGLIFYSLHKMAYSTTEPWVTVAMPYHI